MYIEWNYYAFTLVEEFQLVCSTYDYNDEGVFIYSALMSYNVTFAGFLLLPTLATTTRILYGLNFCSTSFLWALPIQCVVQFVYQKLFPFVSALTNAVVLLLCDYYVCDIKCWLNENVILKHVQHLKFTY